MPTPLLASTLLVASGFALGLAATTLPQEDPVEAAEESPAERHERLVRELLETTHARESMRRGIESQLEAFDAMPFLPEGFGEEFLARFDQDRMFEEAVRVHVELMPVEPIEAALAFFRTEQGAVYATGAVEIQLEMMRIGREYGEELGREVAEDLAR